ncbi:hypothetical protein QFW82_00440 [Streptomyces malaysiensis subsp. malaysiensis]|uniref:hypothetical protein n=1 Tax=Streptomyces malaysiensis TaxID=92644 RepID=UPI0024BF3A55|nr:hypothetical protein [Streptomyces sp. NA07423]WHX15600.1 hypothetical protein QFW82_00440 [Streptomyces sp. NA07423]
MGVAVGQRAANETFKVLLEGIRACEEDPQRWPDAAYREKLCHISFPQITAF